MLRSQPPDNSADLPLRGMPTPFAASTRADTPGAVPHGEDGITHARQLENSAARDADAAGLTDGTEQPEQHDFLRMVRVAEQQAQLYTAQVNRRAWSQSYRAFHNEHYIGSKYTRPEWRNRSRLYVPKTRAAIKKDLAAVAASMFNSMDAISCRAGNEADPHQRASAAIMQELVTYRTDRTSGKAAFPWFLIALGARQDAVITGICLTKQSWLHEYRKVKEETVHEQDEETGKPVRKSRDVFALETDRPTMQLFPPENFVVDPAAPWAEVAQKAAYIILKYPMTVEDILDKMDAPVNPWKQIAEATLRQSVNNGKQDAVAIRRAREMGLDRFDETQTGTEQQIVWVYETFIRHDGEDWNFWSLGDQLYLTDPMPTREAYPAHYGERPISYGYSSLEAHRIFPMSPVESWQPLQVEINDLRNLSLDATKQNVMPISKVRRGRRIDLDQVRRRSAGSSIFVDEPDDVTWETPPSMPEQVFQMSQKLDIEMDDQAGQQNYGNVEQSNALGKTLGGLKLAAGAANAVQEYDIRVWIETWAQPALAQIVQLEQYYESDPIVLGLCGERAQLFEKHGVDKITDKLMEEQIVIQVDVGLGAGDPQQRLAKFQSAASVIGPLLAQTAEFQSGQVELNWEECLQEVFGAVGYRDGGMRFIKNNGQPKPNAMMDLKQEEIKAKILKDQQTGKASMMTGLAAVAKVALGQKELEASVVDSLLGHQISSKDMGAQHADMMHKTHLAAKDHGHRHGIEIAQHRQGVADGNREHAMRQAEFGQGVEDGDRGHAMKQAEFGQSVKNSDRDFQMRQAEAQAGEGARGSGGASPVSPAGATPGPAGPPSAPSPQLSGGQIEFIRDPKTNRITGVKLPQGDADQGSPTPQPQATPEKPPAAPPTHHHAPIPEDRLAKLETLVRELAKPRKRKIVRDKHNRIAGLEEE